MLRKACFAWFAVCIAAAFVCGAAGPEDIVVTLKEEASVHSDTIFLKDVAQLRGTDPVKLERLAQVPLGACPEFGSIRVLGRHQVFELIRAGDGSFREENLAGAAAVQVRIQGRQIDPAEIALLLRDRLLKTTPWKESEISIRSIGSLKGIEMPPGGATLQLSSDATITGHRSILFSVEILQAGKTLKSFWLTAEIGIRAGILTAAKPIPRGKIIGPVDVVERPVEIEDLRADYARNTEDVLGKAARRHFSSGDPITREALTNPLLVKSGDTVRVRLEGNGILLTSLARAEQSGSLGQVIRVRNLDFSTILRAQVTGQSEVRLLQ